MDLFNFDFGALESRCTKKICGGMYHCEDREYDSTKSDCQECIEDYNKTMEELNNPSEELKAELDWVQAEFGPNAYKKEFEFLGKKVRRKNKGKWEEGVVVLDNSFGEEEQVECIEFGPDDREELYGLPFQIWDENKEKWIEP